jgi:hypothetical protein
MGFGQTATCLAVRVRTLGSRFTPRLADELGLSFLQLLVAKIATGRKHFVGAPFDASIFRSRF